LNMPRKHKIVVFGAGRHAKVVLDVLERAGRYTVVGLLDASRELHGTTRWGQKVLGGRDQFGSLLAKGVSLCTARGALWTRRGER